MPYIQLNDRHFPLSSGDTRLGAATDADIRLPGGPDVAAVVHVANEQATIRAVGAAVVRVNGVSLGAQPSPLIHGDKIAVADSELMFGDDRGVGNTAFVPGLDFLQRPSGGNPATAAAAATGGRLVSLVDGREYVVPPAGLTIGRDAACDVVVPSSEVSRRHAMVAPSDDGYTVTDVSTNGLLVNGDRIAGRRPLGRGDVIRVGNEEFRFHAEPAPAGAAAGAAAATNGKAGATQPAAGDAPAVDVIGTLEVLMPPEMAGRRYDLTSPVVHIGRGLGNDVLIADASVSDSHAALVRREGRWSVADLGSTNGTFVGGRRVTVELPVTTGGEIRVGGITLRFTATATGTDTVPAYSDAALARRRARRPAPDDYALPDSERMPTPKHAPAAGVPAAPPRASGWVWAAVAAAAAAAAYFIFQSR